MISDKTRADAQRIIDRYPPGRGRSALLPMLHLVQAEQGHVTAEGVAFCAEMIGLTKAEVGAVATFYTMYKRRPVGEYLISVCTNLSCQILGGEEIFARLSKHLGVGHDETTADGAFTLEHAECLAACDYAPVVTVNYEFFDQETPDGSLRLVQALARGERPAPTRGARLCSFREISRQLAGFVDPRSGTAPTGPAHPQASAPVDSRGSEDTAGTDVGVPPAGYGPPAGVTERVLADEQAAATYAPGGARTAGAAPVPPAAAPAPPAPAPTAPAPATPPSAGKRKRTRGGAKKVTDPRKDAS
jgi:NADH-quinone oxidoreductase subunit E